MGPPGTPTLSVLGVRVHAVQLDEVMDCMEQWVVEKGHNRHIVATGMHGVMEAKRDPDFKKIINSADLLVPDGISLLWIARKHGFKLKSRVTASELMMEFLRLSQDKGYSHFFYGDTEETLTRLISNLRSKFPKLRIAGTHSPPFRPVTNEEEDEGLDLINKSGTDVLWVGLGLPKQEKWIARNRHRLNVPVMLGVGASFKFLSGQVKMAPPSVGRLGLEWLWRFIQEPRRLWRRVFLDGPRFVVYVLLEVTGIKRYD